MNTSTLLMGALILAPLVEIIVATWKKPRRSMVYVYTAWTAMFALLTSINFLGIFSAPASDYSFLSPAGWLDRVLLRIGLYNEHVFWFLISLTLTALSFIARRHCKLALAKNCTGLL
jgi:hypothetical protein